MQAAPPATSLVTTPVNAPATPETAPSPPRKGGRRKPSLSKRARSVPYKRPYISALVATSFFYLALVGAASSVFALAVQPTKSAGALFIGFAGFSALLWLISFFKRRSCNCPLCKGTPFLDNGAHRHQKAVRFLPLNYGHTNLLRGLFRQQFRCQFCGTPFDLLKPIARNKPTQQPTEPFATVGPQS